MKQEEVEKLTKVKARPGTVYIDMDATKVVEQKTAGWTDSQIRNRPLNEIDAMLNSCDLSIKRLEESVEKERKRRQGLLDIRNRKVLLGD